MRNTIIALIALIFISTIAVYLIKPAINKQVRLESPDFYMPSSKEEAVSWNRWRSEVSNLLIGSKLPIHLPKGTKIFVSFQADKEGNISDISLHTSPSESINQLSKPYREYIKSLQHNPKLQFPKNSKRTVVNVSSVFVVADQNVYSTPSDYQDYERVRVKGK